MNCILLKPSQFLNLRCVADECIYFAWTIELWRNLDDHSTIYETNFVFSFTLPCDLLSDLFEAHFNELPHRVCLARRDNIFISLFLLKHEPHGFNIVFCVPPIPRGVEISQFKEFSLTLHNLFDAIGNLLCHKVSTPSRRFVVEENSRAGVHAIGFTVIFDEPVSGQFGDAIDGSWVKGCLLGLWGFPNLTKHL